MPRIWVILVAIAATSFVMHAQPGPAGAQAISGNATTTVPTSAEGEVLLRTLVELVADAEGVGAPERCLAAGAVLPGGDCAPVSDLLAKCSSSECTSAGDLTDLIRLSVDRYCSSLSCAEATQWAALIGRVVEAHCANLACFDPRPWFGLLVDVTSAPCSPAGNFATGMLACQSAAELLADPDPDPDPLDAGEPCADTELIASCPSLTTQIRDADQRQAAEGPTEDPTVPYAEPEPLDDDSGGADGGEPAGTIVALDANTQRSFAAGQLTLSAAMLESAAAAARPPIVCTVTIKRKVGTARSFYGPDPKDPVLRGQFVTWKTTMPCVGGPSALKGVSQLQWKSPSTGVYEGVSYTELYSEAYPYVTIGRTRGKWFEPVLDRKAKRVYYPATIEVPPPYQWTSDEPFGDMKGVNERKTNCNRYVIPYEGHPQYLNGIDCEIWSNRFK